MVRFIKELKDKGFKVVTFDGYHHRVNDEFDFWLNDRSMPISWHDRISGDRGSRQPTQMARFIIKRFTDPPTEVSQELFVSRLVAIGWKKEEAEQEWNARKSKAEPSKHTYTIHKSNSLR
jgi:hypothetical protein